MLQINKKLKILVQKYSKINKTEKAAEEQYLKDQLENLASLTPNPSTSKTYSKLKKSLLIYKKKIIQNAYAKNSSTKHITHKTLLAQFAQKNANITDLVVSNGNPQTSIKQIINIIFFFICHIYPPFIC